jgi:glyoxylase-like metal-dependent hydrolase (beta-lactamase superfamily II)
MTREIKTIKLSLPIRLGSVNCYLIKTDTGYILVDTGGSNKRNALEEELERAGCKPGYLKLIFLTHGDFDHAGNAAYLREKYGSQIAMHYDDLGMVEQGDMFWNRNKPNVLIRTVIPFLSGFGKANRFSPDMYFDEGTDLSEYGLEAKILLIPGHSKGSIGILTADGDLICGDLFENSKNPALNAIMDDPSAAEASVEKLSALKISTVYPGHGQPFPMESLTKNQR